MVVASPAAVSKEVAAVIREGSNDSVCCLSFMVNSGQQQLILVEGQWLLMVCNGLSRSGSVKLTTSLSHSRIDRDPDGYWLNDSWSFGLPCLIE